MTIDTPIGSIEDGDIYETMRKGSFTQPKHITVQQRKPCSTCQWRYICCGGCPLLTFEQKGSYSINSPYCSVYRELIPEVIRVEAKRIQTYGRQLNPQDLQEDVS